jgi:hypothetical protein
MDLSDLVRKPRRLAIGSIRGYRYQLLHTIRAWLEADDNHLIVAEGNEDIDHILIGRAEERWEEQIKFRGDDIPQSNQAITDAIAHSLEAYLHHRNARRRFRGILRTNAVVLTDDETQVGAWIATGQMDRDALVLELRDVLAHHSDALAALEQVIGHGEFHIFVDSVEWAPQSDDIPQLEQEIARLAAQRASRAPKKATRNALMEHALRALTNYDIGQRVLRRIDADVVIGDSILDALAIGERSERARRWHATLWAQQGPPSIAVIVFVEDLDALIAAVRYQEQEDALVSAARPTATVIRSLVKRLDFVAYASIRRSEGRNGQRYVTQDVVRQSSYRLSPNELAVIARPHWRLMVWIGEKWPTLVRINVTSADDVTMQLASIVGNAVAAKDHEMLEAMSSKLRWVHDVDENDFFTAENPFR